MRPIINGIFWGLLVSLAVENARLVHDFKLLAQVRKEDEEQVEAARSIVTDYMFTNIVEEYGDDS